MLMGEYNHTLDAKGRLIIPAKLRDRLGEEFVVTQGLDGCLFAFPYEEWKKFEEKLQQLPLSVAKARNFSRYFLAHAASCELDRQGRILLPYKLRQAAGLEKEVVLAGVGNRVEIWDAARWEQACTFEDPNEIAENMEGLGI